MAVPEIRAKFRIECGREGGKGRRTVWSSSCWDGTTFCSRVPQFDPRFCQTLTRPHGETAHPSGSVKFPWRSKGRGTGILGPGLVLGQRRVWAGKSFSVFGHIRLSHGVAQGTSRNPYALGAPAESPQSGAPLPAAHGPQGPLCLLLPKAWVRIRAVDRYQHVQAPTELPPRRR